MIAWWWTVLALLGGAAFGILMAGLFSANDPPKQGKKWWDE